MMQKLTYLALAGLVLSFQACGTLSTLPAIDLPSAASNLPSVPMQKKLSQDEAASGLKEALVKGVGVGTDRLQKPVDFLKTRFIKSYFHQKFNRWKAKYVETPCSMRR